MEKQLTKSCFFGIKNKIFGVNYNKGLKIRLFYFFKWDSSGLTPFCPQFEHMNNCPPNYVFITIGFGGLLGGLAAVNSALSFAIAITGSVVVGTVIENTLKNC